MNCDPIARGYRWLEYSGFGGELERRRCAFLAELAHAKRVLVLGGGDGRYLGELVRRNRGAAIDYVDLSRKMLDLARGRGGDSVTYLHADALEIALPEGEYDLIVTHFFLDCFEREDLEKLIGRVARFARPDAGWMVAEFRQPAAWARWIVRGLYGFFRVTTGLKTTRLADHRPLLPQYGFHLEKEQTSRFGLLASELWIRRTTSDGSS